MTKHVKELLHTILPTQNTWQLYIIQNWETIVGDLKEYVRLERIQDDNTLLLGVTHTTWMQELYYLSDVIIQKINTKLEYPHVKHLRFKYTPRKKKFVEHTIIAKSKPICKTITLTPRQKKALEYIDDQQLQEALTNFLIRCTREY